MIVNKYSDRVYAQTRMPFLHLKAQEGKQVLIGETDFVHPDDESDQVFIKIYLAAPKFTPAMDKDFSEKYENFPESVCIKDYIRQLDRDVLKKAVQEKGGITVNLRGGASRFIEHKKHFFMDARDMLSHTN